MDCHAFEFMQRALQDLRKTAYSLDSRVSPSSREAAAWGWGPEPNLWHWPVFFLPSSGSSVRRGILGAGLTHEHIQPPGGRVPPAPRPGPEKEPPVSFSIPPHRGQ